MCSYNFHFTLSNKYIWFIWYFITKLGAYKKDKCALKSFIICAIIWTLIYLGGGTFIYIILPDFTNGNCTVNSIFVRFQHFY